MNHTSENWTEEDQQASEPDFYGKWISVNARLPEYEAHAGSDNFVHVLTSHNGLVGQSMYCNGKWESLYFGDIPPTYWMPLPEPPED